MTITREAAIAARIEDWSGLLTPAQMAMEAASFGAGWDARPGIIDDHEVCTTDLAKATAERDASRAVNADLLAAQHRLIATLARVQTVVDDERIPDQVFGDDWVLAELLTKALAPPDSLAAEHRADLARQDDHYRKNPMNDDTGRDE